MTEEERECVAVFEKKDILVYGALNYAYAAVDSLQTLVPGHVVGCAVTKMGNNPPEVKGIPVREIDSYHLDKENTIVIIATTPIYYSEIQRDLYRRGYLHVLTYSGHRGNILFRFRTKHFLAERLGLEREE